MSRLASGSYESLGLVELHGALQHRDRGCIFPRPVHLTGRSRVLKNARHSAYACAGSRPSLAFQPDPNDEAKNPTMPNTMHMPTSPSLQMLRLRTDSNQPRKGWLIQADEDQGPHRQLLLLVARPPSLDGGARCKCTAQVAGKPSTAAHRKRVAALAAPCSGSAVGATIALRAPTAVHEVVHIRDVVEFGYSAVLVQIWALVWRHGLGEVCNDFVWHQGMAEIEFSDVRLRWD